MLGLVLVSGAYDEEEAAARAYDLAALKYWGPGTLINFPVSTFETEAIRTSFVICLVRCGKLVPSISVVSSLLRSNVLESVVFSALLYVNRLTELSVDCR